MLVYLVPNYSKESKFILIGLWLPCMMGPALDSLVSAEISGAL